MGFFDDLKKKTTGFYHQINPFDSGRTYSTHMNSVTKGNANAGIIKDFQIDQQKGVTTQNLGLNRGGEVPISILGKPTAVPDTFKPTRLSDIRNAMPGPYTDNYLNAIRTNYDKMRLTRSQELRDQLRTEPTNFWNSGVKDILDANSTMDRLKRIEAGEDEMHYQPIAPGEARNPFEAVAYPVVGAASNLLYKAGTGLNKLSFVPTKLLPGGEESLPDKIADAAFSFFDKGEDIMDKNILESRFSTTPRAGESPLSVNLGSGAGSLAVGLPMTALSPGLTTVIFGASAGNEIERNARESGMSPWQSTALGVGGGLTEGLIESKLNVKFLEAGTGSFVTNMIKRATIEAIQEGSQSMGGALWNAPAEGLDLNAAFKQAATEAGYGAILGSGANVTMATAQQIGADQRFQNALKENIWEQLHANQGGFVQLPGGQNVPGADFQADKNIDQETGEVIRNVFEEAKLDPNGNAAEQSVYIAGVLKQTAPELYSRITDRAKKSGYPRALKSQDVTSSFIQEQIQYLYPGTDTVNQHLQDLGATTYAGQLDKTFEEKYRKVKEEADATPRPEGTKRFWQFGETDYLADNVETLAQQGSTIDKTDDIRFLDLKEGEYREEVGKPGVARLNPIEQFAYHQTSPENINSIREGGLRKTKGQYGEGVYFAPNEEGTYGWTGQEGSMLRVRNDILRDKYGYDAFDEQGWTEKDVAPEDIEIQQDGKWQPLIEEFRKGDAKFIETAKQSINTAPEVAEGLMPREVQLISNQNALARAQISIDKKGFDQAVQEAKTETKPSLELQAESLLLIDQLQEQKRYDEAIELIDSFAARATKAGQEVQIAAAYNRLTPEGVVRAAQKQVEAYNRSKRGKKRANRKGELKLDPENAEALRNKAKEIADMQPGEAKSRAQIELADDIQAVVPTPMSRKIMTFWKAGLLTGIKGGVFGNAVGNSSFQLMKKIADVPAAGLDAAIAQATGNRSKIFTIRGLLGGTIEGSKIGYDNFMNNTGEEDLAIKWDFQKTRYGDGPLGRAAQFYTDKVFGFYSAADKPFYYAALNNTLQDRARVEAKNEGLKGAEAEARVAELIKNPPSEMNEAAVDDALTLVFQNRGTMSGALSDVKKRMRESGAAGEVISEGLMPFTGVPSNVATAVLQYNPVAGAIGIKDAVNVIKQSNKGNYDQEAQRQAVEKIGKGMTGTGIIALGAALFSSGLLTLSFPDDKDERALWEQEGKMPFSVKIGGKWRSLNYAGPATVLLGMGGHYANSRDNGGSVIDSTTSALLGFPSTIIDSSPLQGLQSAKEAIDAVGQEGKEAIPSGALRYLNNTIGSAVPTFVKDVARATDPYERQVNNPLDALLTRLPGASRTLEPKVDNFGRPIETYTPGIGAIVDPFKSRGPRGNDELTEELRSLQDAKVEGDLVLANPKITPSSWGMEDMSEGQKSSIMSAVYPEVQERWEDIIKRDTYKNLSPADKRSLLDKERDAIIKKRKEEFKALETDEERATYTKNAMLRYLDKKPVSEDDFLSMVSENLKAWVNDPVQAAKYLGKEKIRRVDNGRIIVHRDGDKASDVRDELGAGDDVELDHILPLQLGGSNDRDNLELVDIETHKEYSAYGNAIANRMRAGTMNKNEAKDTFLKLRSGEMSLDQVINPGPDGNPDKVSFTPTDENAPENEATTSSTSNETASRDTYYQDKYDNAVAKLQDPETGLTDVTRAKLEKDIATYDVKRQFTRDVIDLYTMSKADAYEFLKTADNKEELATGIVEYGDAMVDAGLWKYNKYRDKSGNVSIAPKTKSSGGRSSKKAKTPKAGSYTSPSRDLVALINSIAGQTGQGGIGQFKIKRRV